MQRRVAALRRIHGRLKRAHAARNAAHAMALHRVWSSSSLRASSSAPQGPSSLSGLSLIPGTPLATHRREAPPPAVGVALQLLDSLLALVRDPTCEPRQRADFLAQVAPLLIELPPLSLAPLSSPQQLLSSSPGHASSAKPTHAEERSSSFSSEDGVLDSLRDFLYASSLPGPYFTPQPTQASETAPRGSRGRRRGRGADEMLHHSNSNIRGDDASSTSTVRMALASPSLHVQRSDAAAALLVLAAARGTAADLLIAVKVLLGVGLPCHTDADAAAFQRAAAAAEAKSAMQRSSSNSRRRGDNSSSGLTSELREPISEAAAVEPMSASLKPPVLEVPNSNSNNSSHVLSRRRLPLTKGRMPSRKHAVSAAEAALDAALEAADESNDYSKLHKDKDWGHHDKDWSKVPPRGVDSRLDPLGAPTSRQRVALEKGSLPLPAKDFEALDPAATDDGGCATWESDYEDSGFGAVNAKPQIGLLHQQQQQTNPDDEEKGEAAAVVGVGPPLLEYQWGSVEKKQARMLLKPDLLKKSPPAPVTGAAMPMMVGNHDASSSSGREARDFLPLLMQKEPLSAKSLLRAKQQQQAAAQAVDALHGPQGAREEPAEDSRDVQDVNSVEPKITPTSFARPTVAPLRGASVLQALRHLAAAPIPRAIGSLGTSPHMNSGDGSSNDGDGAAVEVWTCGQNSYGELGHSEQGPLGPRPKLFRVEGLVGQRVRGVAAGNEHTVVVTKDGQVMSVGYNDNGQCGTGSLGRCNSFAAVTMNVTAAAAAAAAAAACAEEKPDEQTTIGSSRDGDSTGNGSSNANSNGSRVVASSVHAYNGCEHTVVVLKDGRAVSFGYNYRGQLGHSAAQSEPIPKLVQGLEGRKVSHVSCSYYHTVLACSDGAVFSFGRGDHGQLGHGDALDRKHPTRVESLAATATTAAASTGVVSLGCGQYHSCVVLFDGRVLGCGKNDYGQVGLETPESQRQFVTVKLPTPASAVQSVSCGYYHTVALCVSGSVYGWGRCDYGQLGLGYASARVFGPHCVELLENCNACVVACGCYHTVVASSDGALHVMGRNNHGQLGTGNTVEAHAPVVLPQFKGRKVRSIACGFYHTVVLTGGGHSDSSDSDESDTSACEDNSENEEGFQSANGDGLTGATPSSSKASLKGKRSRRKKAKALAMAPQPFSPEFLLNLPQFSLVRSSSMPTEPSDLTRATTTADEEQASSVSSSSLPTNTSVAAPQGDDDEENERLVPRALHFSLPGDATSTMENHSRVLASSSGVSPAAENTASTKSERGKALEIGGGDGKESAAPSDGNDSSKTSARLQHIVQQDAAFSSGSLVDHKGGIMPERAAMFVLAHLARLSTTRAQQEKESKVGGNNALPPFRAGRSAGERIDLLAQEQQQPYSVDAKPATLEALLSLLASLHRTAVVPFTSKTDAAPVTELDTNPTTTNSELRTSTFKEECNAPPPLPGFDGGGSRAAQAAYKYVYHPTMVLSCLQILSANFHAFLASPIAAAVVDTLRAKPNKQTRRIAPSSVRTNHMHREHTSDGNDNDDQVEGDDPSAQLNSSKGASEGALSHATSAAFAVGGDKDGVIKAKRKKRGRQGRGSTWVPDSTWTSDDFEEQRRALLFALPPLTRGALPRGNDNSSYSGEATRNEATSECRYSGEATRNEATSECRRYCAVLPLLQQQLVALVMGAAATTEADTSSQRSEATLNDDNEINDDFDNNDGTSSVMVQRAAADLLVLGLEMFYPSAHSQATLLRDLLNTPPATSDDDVVCTTPLFGAAAARHFLLQPLLKTLTTDAFASQLLPTTLGSSSSSVDTSSSASVSTDACATLDSLLQVLVLHCSNDEDGKEEVKEGVSKKGARSVETRRLLTALLLALQTHLASWSASPDAPMKGEVSVNFKQDLSLNSRTSAVAQAAVALDREAVLTPGWACLLGYAFIVKAEYPDVLFETIAHLSLAYFSETFHLSSSQICRVRTPSCLVAFRGFFE